MKRLRVSDSLLRGPSAHDMIVFAVLAPPADSPKHQPWRYRERIQERIDAMRRVIDELRESR